VGDVLINGKIFYKKTFRSARAMLPS
jgi:hypothetical protein